MGYKPKFSLKKPLILSSFILSLSLVVLLKYNYFIKQSKFEFESESKIPRTTQIDHHQYHQHPRWYQEITNELISSTTTERRRRRKMRVGLVNIDEKGSKKMEFLSKLDDQVEILKVKFEAAVNVEWKNLYPNWINESDSRNQHCPDIPMPEFNDYGELDVIVAKVPECSSREGNCGRDVLRLQVNLVVANMLVHQKKFITNYSKYVVFMGSSPMMEIFRCDDLLWEEGIWSLYRPDFRKLKHKLMMPVGACKLAPPPFLAGTGE